MSGHNLRQPINVRGTEIVPGDPARIRLQKLARITLDSMVQFVGLLDSSSIALPYIGVRVHRWLRTHFDSQLDDPPIVSAGDLTEGRRTELIAGLIEPHGCRAPSA